MWEWWEVEAKVRDGSRTHDGTGLIGGESGLDGNRAARHNAVKT